MATCRTFLSYRRGDSIGHTGRLHDRLAARWGVENVFWDIDNLAPGEDFIEAIDGTLARCDVVLVVIGPRWLETQDSDGSRRIDNPADLHRLEIETALNLRLRVVPVLVDGAKIPNPERLPESIRSLVRRNAFEITDQRFDFDSTKLIDSLERSLSRVEPAPLPGGITGTNPSSYGRTGRRKYVLGLSGLAVVLVAIVGLNALVGRRKEEERLPASAPTSSQQAPAQTASPTPVKFTIYGGFFPTESAAQLRADKITAALNSRKIAWVFEVSQQNRYLVGVSGFETREQAAEALAILMQQSLTTDSDIRAIPQQ